MCVRGRERVFIVALGVLQALTVCSLKKNPVRDRFQWETGAESASFLHLPPLLLLPPPTGGESRPLTIRFRPSEPRTLIDACQSVPRAALRG